MKNSLNSLALHVYSLFLNCFRYGIIPLLGKQRARTMHVRARNRLPYAVKPFNGKVVHWLHAASLGEAKLLLQFLRILEQKKPGVVYVLTATSETGVAFLEKNKPDTACAIGYLPFDTIPLMKRMLKSFSISRVWIMETEIWPALLWVCRKRNVPVGIVNGRLEEKSFEAYKTFGFLFRTLFEYLNPVLVQNEVYGERFEKLGVDGHNISVIGNLKSHVVIKRPSQEKWAAIRSDLAIGDELVITVGCVHKDEAVIISTACEEMRESGMKVKWIIVPRHLKSTMPIVNQLAADVLHLTALSAGRDWHVAVIEAYGVLETVYMIADAAVVGGTFVQIGGHNVWEAAQYGIPVFFGPHTHAQQQSCDRLQSAGVGFQVEDGKELASRIIKTLKTEARAFIDAQMKFSASMNESVHFLEQLIV